MYQCPDCGSTEHIIAYFQTLVKRGYDPEYDTWLNPEMTNEEEREPVKLECENCYDNTSDPDSWWEREATRRYKCYRCGEAASESEEDYCAECNAADGE